jgi:hypothetical protein
MSSFILHGHPSSGDSGYRYLKVAMVPNLLNKKTPNHSSQIGISQQASWDKATKTHYTLRSLKRDGAF